MDHLIQNYLVGIRTPELTQFFYIITKVFDYSFPFIAVIFFIAFIIYLVKGFKHSFLFVFANMFGTGLVFFLKHLFLVTRPDHSITVVFGKSFPSYHATIATIFFCMLIYIFDSYLSKGLRQVFNFLCILSIILVSFSRLYLGAHWFSDVFFGVVLGFFVYSTSVNIFSHAFRKNHHRKNMH